MTSSVGHGATTQVVLARDSSSATYGNGDGFTLCGSRSYTITPSYPSILSLSSGNTLVLSTDDISEVTAAPISITISASLDDYPWIPAVQSTFTIEIVCQVAQISW